MDILKILLVIGIFVLLVVESYKGKKIDEDHKKTRRDFKHDDILSVLRKYNKTGSHDEECVTEILDKVCGI